MSVKESSMNKPDKVIKLEEVKEELENLKDVFAIYLSRSLAFYDSFAKYNTKGDDRATLETMLSDLDRWTETFDIVRPFTEKYMDE